MSDKKQTALQWLLEQWPILQSQLPSSIIDEVLKMEREQIIDAYYEGKEYGFKEQGEQYYNETYGGQDESNY
jgi:hypothetical protein